MSARIAVRFALFVLFTGLASRSGAQPAAPTPDEFGTQDGIDLWIPFSSFFGSNGYAFEVVMPSSYNVRFKGVRVFWHRQVSPAPATATFNDVPTSDSGFQYIEALVASGITAGCGGGNYCPDATLTRRQMAVFLSKALGLHWPPF